MGQLQSRFGLEKVPFNLRQDKMKMVLALLVLLVALARESHGNQAFQSYLYGKVFDSYDTNDSGSWSLDEASKYLINQMSLERLFEVADADGNGELSKDESMMV